MVKISSDLTDQDLLNWRTWRHVEGNFRFGRVEKLRHVDLINNYNVGNVYTDT